MTLDQENREALAVYAQRIMGLESTLRAINDTIYAIGAPLGSPEYFRVRALCCDALKVVP